MGTLKQTLSCNFMKKRPTTPSTGLENLLLTILFIQGNSLHSVFYEKQIKILQFER